MTEFEKNLLHGNWNYEYHCKNREPTWKFVSSSQANIDIDSEYELEWEIRNSYAHTSNNNRTQEGFCML